MSSIENLINRLTSPYNNETTGNNYKLLTIDAKQFDEIKTMLEDVRDSHWAEIAFGKSLDYIGSLVATYREIGELDDDYRVRILGAIATYIGGGTPLAIRTVVSNYLNIPIDDVYVFDGYLVAGAYAHFIVVIATHGFVVTPLVNEIMKAKAAGVALDGVGPYLRDTFIVTDYLTLLPDSFILQDTFKIASADIGTPNPLFIHRTDVTYTDSLNVTG